MPHPRQTDYVQRLAWQGITCRLRETRNHRLEGWTRLVLEVLAPHNAEVPLGDGSRFVHELDALELSARGGAAAFIAAWLDRAAQTKRWRRRRLARQQLDLFDH